MVAWLEQRPEVGCTGVHLHDAGAQPSAMCAGYSIYDMDLSGVNSNLELRALLTQVSDRAVVVVEDIDTGGCLTAVASLLHVHVTVSLCTCQHAMQS